MIVMDKHIASVVAQTAGEVGREEEDQERIAEARVSCQGTAACVLQSTPGIPTESME